MRGVVPMAKVPGSGKQSSQISPRSLFACGQGLSIYAEPKSRRSATDQERCAIEVHLRDNKIRERQRDRPRATSRT